MFSFRFEAKIQSVLSNHSGWKNDSVAKVRNTPVSWISMSHFSQMMRSFDWINSTASTFKITCPSCNGIAPHPSQSRIPSLHYSFHQEQIKKCQNAKNFNLSTQNPETRSILTKKEKYILGRSLTTN
ncbi:hypothetical protein BLNAU_12721 [Blattamonas nauphoetae]|uniref:Uncharacterized protein n=1 Tax=Blattamonas nauphoetae TaxID=2049346 RepID=A0ABQ9XIR0_9EUKA|nr:hypothetical protein BLNAU_12721 [Blattamonas nauphoetae]